MSDTYTIGSYTIRAEMLASLRRYANDGTPVGGFLNAVLSNEFMESCWAADDENMSALPAYAYYIYQEMPSQCHGSREKVKAWIKMHADKLPQAEVK